MIEILTSFTIAAIAGVLAGMVPGISTFVVLVSLYPLLLIIEPVNAIMVYVIIVSISQYFGSVAATFFCIPGSTTAIASMHEAHTLFKQGLGDHAIMFTAAGSFIGSVVSIAFSIVFIYSAPILYAFFSTYVKAFIFLLVLVVFIFVGKNSALTNILMIIGGYALAEIGYNSWTDTSFLTFGIASLYSGIPTLVVILALYVLPLIISNIKKQPSIITFTKLSVSGYIQTFKQLVNYKWVLLRGSLLGYFTGFIPGITFYLGTTLAYYFEKYIRQKADKYKIGDLNCLLSAETANNAGVFSQLLPLLIVGIPITASQAFMYEIFISNGVLLTSAFFYSMFMQLGIAYIISAIIGLYFAGKYVNWLSFVSKVNYNYIYYILLVVLFCVVYYIGAMFYKQWFYIACLLVLLPVGWLLRKLDVLPLIFTFLLHDHIYTTFLTLLYLI